MGVLRQAKVPRSYLTREQRTALKELKGLKDEVILPADENATVMMRGWHKFTPFETVTS